VLVYFVKKNLATLLESKHLKNRNYRREDHFLTRATDCVQTLEVGSTPASAESRGARFLLM
jgi:hypothetical protein